MLGIMVKKIILFFVSVAFFAFGQNSFAALGDLVGSFDTAADGVLNPTCIGQYNGYLYICDNSDDEVYIFQTDGTYTGTSFDTAGSGNNTPWGFEAYGGYLWVTDGDDGEVYKYNTDGSYASDSFDTSADGADNIRSITYYNGFFWILDVVDDLVYKYETDGTYTGTSFSTQVTMSSEFPFGLTNYDNHLWVSETTNDEIYKFQTDGTYTGTSFDTAGSGNASPRGMVAYNNYFWITDDTDQEVYQYEVDPDVINPSISSLTPLDGATDVSASTNLTLEFGEVVVVGTGNVTIKLVEDDSIVEAIDVTSGQVTGSTTDTIVINPSSDLSTSTVNYYIQVDATAFDDLVGNSYAGISDSTTWNFSTADVANPTVSTLTPLDDADEIEVDANLVIVFSEAVNVESGNVTLYLAEDDSIVEAIDVTSGQVTGDGTTTITIDPTADLTRGASYYIQIDATAFDDAASNSYAGISDETTWNFEAVAPVVVGIISSGSRSAKKQASNYKGQVFPEEDTCLSGHLFNINTGKKCSPSEEGAIFTIDLKRGDKNFEVKVLQEYLNNNGFILTDVGLGSLGQETDFFGNLTYQALKKFQQDRGVVSDGIVGPITRGLLNSIK